MEMVDEVKHEVGQIWHRARPEEVTGARLFRIDHIGEVPGAGGSRAARGMWLSLLSVTDEYFLSNMTEENGWALVSQPWSRAGVPLAEKPVPVSQKWLTDTLVDARGAERAAIEALLQEQINYWRSRDAEPAADAALFCLKRIRSGEHLKAFGSSPPGAPGVHDDAVVKLGLVADALRKYDATHALNALRETPPACVFIAEVRNILQVSKTTQEMADGLVRSTVKRRDEEWAKAWTAAFGDPAPSNPKYVASHASRILRAAKSPPPPSPILSPEKQVGRTNDSVRLAVQARDAEWVNAWRTAGWVEAPRDPVTAATLLAREKAWARTEEER